MVAISYLDMREGGKVRVHVSTNTGFEVEGVIQVITGTEEMGGVKLIGNLRKRTGGSEERRWL